MATNRVTDPTFRSYTAQQAATYAKDRLSFPPALAKALLERHVQTGGAQGVALDVGTGTGQAARAVGPHFDVVHGVDPGQAMLDQAAAIGGTSRAGNPILFHLSTAEDIDQIPALQHGSVDLISAATAAHWFDMPKFFAAAAKLLKPCGSIMIWSFFEKTDPVPGNEVGSELTIPMRKFRDALEPYMQPGNRIAENGYLKLGMPWDTPATGALYDQSLFSRTEFKAMDLLGAEFLEKLPGTPLQRYKALIKTMGPYTRWREANPDLVDTDKDVVTVCIREMQEVFDKKGTQEATQAMMETAWAVLICVKRNGTVA